MRLRPVQSFALTTCVLGVLSASLDGRSASPTAGSQPSTASSSDPALQEAVRAAVTEPSLSGAAIGVNIVDVDSGRALAEFSEHLPLNPASNAKLYTAAAALAILHGEHHYETTLSGNLRGEAVAGPLVLRGYGDPSLKTADLWEMVQELKDYGVKRIDGDIDVDQAFYDEQTKPPDFDQQPNEWSGFRAPISAVALNENCITIAVYPSPSGAPARVELDPPGFVDVAGTVDTVHAAGADTVLVELAGTADQRM